MFGRNYNSALLEDAVDQFASLPGVGRKTALRLALHMLGQPEENVHRFADAFLKLKSQIHYCPDCNMISGDGICP